MTDLQVSVQRINITLPEIGAAAACSHQFPPEKSRCAVRVLADWSEHSRPGDWARAMWLPEPQAVAFYGAALPQFVRDLFPALICGGDIAFINAAGMVYAVMPRAIFEAMAVAS